MYSAAVCPLCLYIPNSPEPIYEKTLEHFITLSVHFPAGLWTFPRFQKHHNTFISHGITRQKTGLSWTP